MQLALTTAFILFMVALALVLARPRRDPKLVLELLGFSNGGLRRGHLDLRATTDGNHLSVSIALRRAPLGYDRLARALGRGDLLASMHVLAVEVDTGKLSAIAPKDSRLRALRRWLDDLVRLAEQLEALPIEEAVARWTLEHGNPNG